MDKYLKLLNLRKRIVLALLAVSFLCSSLFMFYGYIADRKTLINTLDKQMLLAVLTMEQFLPPDFVERCMTDDAVSLEEKRTVMRSILTLCDHSEMTYLYIVAREKTTGKYILVLDTGGATEEEPEKGYGIEYTNPWIGIVQTLEDGQTRYTDGHDDYGYARGVFVRRTTSTGQHYILGVDLKIDNIVQMKHETFLTFLGISTFSFCVAFIVGCLLARRIAEPIRKLSDYTIHLVSSGFSPELHIPEELLDYPKQSKNECFLLAEDINLMQSELSDYLDELKAVTKEKESAESELRIAGEIQKSYLPDKPPKNDRIDLAATLVPARHAAGDLYDYTLLNDDKIFFALGDVSGKGMPAALFMSMVLTLIRAGRQRNLSLPELMALVNDSLSASNPECTFVTLILGIIDTKTGEVSYCNGGHNPPLLQTADGQVSYLPKASNPLVGVMPEIKFELRFQQLEPEDRLIFYTDGVTEAMAVDDSLFGEDRLLETVSQTPKEATSSMIVSEIFNAIEKFARGRSQSDDITILCCRRKANAATMV